MANITVSLTEKQANVLKVLLKDKIDFYKKHKTGFDSADAILESINDDFVEIISLLTPETDQ